ncbi:MAG: methionine--tRNA ligase [Candidatus Nealsonbacteria bacterium]|nr:methionine--tRNA ligase [Candidatus Nealsonbacteria bacterium]
MAKKKFYITTSIAYTNAPVHIGFALELAQADVIARYHRLLGENVFFLTGTDEHGIKIARAAEKAGKTPKEFTDEISLQFKELTKVLNISNNDFIRTTDQKRHWPTVKKVWLKLKENGDIYKKKYKGLYCVGCEAFIKEKDLVEEKCQYHKTKPDIIEEENYFFKLSKYASLVKKVIETDKIKIIPVVRKNEILSFIEQGIEDISCSRSREKLKWGIPVPDDDSQTIYIWLEALLNYLFPKKYWPADVHCLGKDIFRFHVLLWPALIFSLKLSLPKAILVHGFITVDGQKISKSLGNVVDPFELVKKYGVDPVRYFLLREIPSTEDGDFTIEKFEQRYNADLAKGLGNLVSRVVTMAGKIKSQKIKSKNQEVDKAKKDWQKSLDEFKFNEALAVIWGLIGWCDRYIEKEKPWETKDEKVINDLLFTLSNIAEMLKPFLPETSEKILEQIKTLPAGRQVKKGKPLFPRL